MSIIELKKQINYYFNNTYLSKYPSSVKDMIVYLFGDGKRVRPSLFIAFNHIVNLPEIGIEKVLQFKNNKKQEEDYTIWIEYAINIELLHSLSLVIDDLPEMDNEIERRGKPCFHIKYGQQKTNFFLYYMFSKISNNLTNLLIFHNNNYHSSLLNSNRILDDTNFIIHYLINNLIDGQYIDITNCKSSVSDIQSGIDNNIIIVLHIIMSIYLDTDDKACIDTNKTDFHSENEIKINPNNISFKKHIILNIKKTGSLFALPIITGFLLQLYKQKYTYTGTEVILDDFYIPNDTNNFNKIYLGTNNLINLIMYWALILGFLFQTSDDFLDRETDLINNKPNICNIMSVENSLRLLSRCTLLCRLMFDYIYKNIIIYWPNFVIDISCINEIINLIESRYQS